MSLVAFLCVDRKCVQSLTHREHTCGNNLPNMCFVATRVCSVNNGGCTQQCIEDEHGGAKCVCDKGYRLAEDERTCIGTFYSAVAIIIIIIVEYTLDIRLPSSE